MIPVASPLAAYRRRQAEFDQALQRVMASGRYILGPEVEAFEAEFAAAVGLPHALGVASGTEALWLALRALGVSGGDEVIVASMTASATVAAIVEAGARPVFAEVREQDLNIDPERAASLITPRTRAIVAVHLYGNPADLPALQALAAARGVWLVEDCAQAHGARRAGRPAGSFGDAAAWSFYPTKNLGAFGDGGLAAARNGEIAQRLKLLREYGWSERYHSHSHGWNSRLDEVQAALLRLRLRHLEEDNARRQAVAGLYRAALGPAGLRGPVSAEPGSGVEHLFVVRHPRRDALRQALYQGDIGTAIQYPVPCHLQAAYAHFGGGPGSLPVTEQAAREVFSLPMYPELSDTEVQQVIEQTLAALAEIQE